MKKTSKILSILLLPILSIALVSSCAGAPTTTPETTGTTPATTTAATTTAPTTTAPTTTEAKEVPFKIEVVPQELKGFSIAGQQCVFLITITEEGQKGEKAVEITAKATGAEVIVNKKTVLAGQVAEVTVIPAQSSVGKAVEVIFTGSRGNITDNKTITFEVIEGTDDRQEYAKELQARFIAWLAKERPELGISKDTKWTGTMVSPQWLVVSHYLFFSDEWEMHIEWHIMTAPSDWTRIDLRKRYSEVNPSLAFEISSVTNKTDPKPMVVPETVWR